MPITLEMIFTRSLPEQQYRQYTSYRQILRRDFNYRCAYCLTHEYHVGGEAGCNIDHHRPTRGPYARPDLECSYSNLYWTCSECNGNKGDTWPALEDYENGRRFIDPCMPEDDHDLHWNILPDGSIEPLTPTGAYTVAILKLWRAKLKDHRACLCRWQKILDDIVSLLASKEMSPEERVLWEAQAVEWRRQLEPPTFNRPRSG